MHSVAVKDYMKEQASLLSPSQVAKFHDDGYLVIPNFVSADICDLLMERAHRLIDGFDPGVVKTIFSTKDQRHARNNYFLDSGDKIHFFFEENAIDENGNLKYDKHKCINKFGHAMHDLDPVFNCFTRMHKNAVLFQELGLIDPQILISMYICKQPHIGGEVNCHQDATYLYAKHSPVIGLWYALEDATLENGCLWMVPGGHKGKLKSRYIREGSATRVETYDESKWAESEMVPVEVSRGSVIAIHGLTPHMSKENTSAKSRHAFTLHAVSKDGGFAEDNWLQRPANSPFSSF